MEIIIATTAMLVFFSVAKARLTKKSVPEEWETLMQKRRYEDNHWATYDTPSYIRMKK